MDNTTIAGLVGFGLLAMMVFLLVGFNYLNKKGEKGSDTSSSDKSAGTNSQTAGTLVVTSLAIFLLLMGLFTTCCCFLPCCCGCCQGSSTTGTTAGYPDGNGGCRWSPCCSWCCPSRVNPQFTSAPSSAPTYQPRRHF